MFANRVDAGRRLAGRLTHLRGSAPVVVGLPRGGVPVAYEVARALHAPLDVLVVRKLGVPYQPELAMGAIGEDSVTVINSGVLKAARSGPRSSTRRSGRPPGSCASSSESCAVVGRVFRWLVVVDDGIATGAIARAACRVARAQGAARIVLAAPVGSPATVAALGDVADEVVCLDTPTQIREVGEYYQEFSPNTTPKLSHCSN
jgi:putative phosphoribosyl transferase